MTAHRPRALRRIAVTTTPSAADDWRQQATCRDESPEAFFVDAGYLGKRLSREGVHLAVAEAKAVCGRCPVIDACAEWAFENDERWGIWGGLTEDERARMRRRAERKRKEPEHGTLAGAKQHYRLGEKPCVSCAQADARHTQDYNARKKAERA